MIYNIWLQWRWKWNNKSPAISYCGFPCVLLYVCVSIFLNNYLTWCEYFSGWSQVLKAYDKMSMIWRCMGCYLPGTIFCHYMGCIWPLLTEATTRIQTCSLLNKYYFGCISWTWPNIMLCRIMFIHYSIMNPWEFAVEYEWTNLVITGYAAFWQSTAYPIFAHCPLGDLNVVLKM